MSARDRVRVILDALARDVQLEECDACTQPEVLDDDTARDARRAGRLAALDAIDTATL